MKHFYNILLLFCVLFLATSCEKGLFDPEPRSSCLEIRQVEENGSAIEKTYDGNRITRYQFYSDQTPLNYYEFVYGEDGHINEIKYLDATGNPNAPSEFITYDDAGNWVKSTVTHSNGDVTTYAATYDSEGQVQEITSSTNKAGTVVENYKATYTWENGNNIRRTYATPTQQTEVQYEFDLDRENKRRRQQRKISFLSLAVAHNKNMFRRITTTSATTGAATTVAVSNYTYEYDEYGYPTSAIRSTAVNAEAPVSYSVSYQYDCD